MAYREIILSKINEYVHAKQVSFAGRGAVVMIDCPYCQFVKSAQIVQALGKIHCVHCGQKFNLVDLVRHVEDKVEETEDEILQYLRDFLNLDVQTTTDADNIEKIFKTYEDRNWALVPCAKSAPIGHSGLKIATGKEVIQAEWQKKENRKPSEWFHWYSSGCNLGVRTGEVSNLTIIDFDLLSKAEKIELIKDTTSPERKAEIQAKKCIPEEVKKLMGDTLMQESHGGFHAFYLYTPELRKTSFNYEVEGNRSIHIDVENEGGQVIIVPSTKVGVDEEFEENGDTKKRIVGHASRKFINENQMIPIPEEFLTWLKAKTDRTPKTSVETSGIIDTPSITVPEDFKLKDIQSNRNNTLLALGGIFRKEMNIKQTVFALSVLNKHLLDNPLPNAEIQHMAEGLANYIGFDDATLANDIVAYLKDTDTASKMEIEAACFGGRTTSENKKRLDRTLMDLLKAEKIIKKNSKDYKILKDMEWSDQICNVGKAVDFKVPYFHDYAHFNYGDVVLVGGTTKVGKSTLAMNMVKRLVDQGIKPYYIFNENGSRYTKTALRLGLKDGDFYRARCTNSADLILRPNSVYIYDWFRPNDFTRTAELFDSLADKLDKANSFMICFAQLRDGTEQAGNKNEWFAKDQIRQFVACSAKYLYADKDGIDTFFELNDIRDSKQGAKRFKVPCKFVRESMEVKLLEELDRSEPKPEVGNE